MAAFDAGAHARAWRPGDDVVRFVGNYEQRKQSALALYRAMKATGMLRRAMLIEYRCPTPRGCLLLGIFATPHGPAWYTPPFKFSPERNARTSPEARSERTTDGDRRWRDRADLLDTEDPWEDLALYCDHTLNTLLPLRRVVTDLEAGVRGRVSINGV